MSSAYELKRFVVKSRFEQIVCRFFEFAFALQILLDKLLLTQEVKSLSKSPKSGLEFV